MFSFDNLRVTANGGSSEAAAPPNTHTHSHTTPSSFFLSEITVQMKREKLQALRSHFMSREGGGWGGDHPKRRPGTGEHATHTHTNKPHS